jgi:hypothetical protein
MLDGGKMTGIESADEIIDSLQSGVLMSNYYH